MKNLLSKKEFKKVSESLYPGLETYDKLYEEGGNMDFSNEVGWSESIVGRMVNKIFSFGKTIVDTQVLKSLKRKVENEYLFGVFKSMAKHNITSEEIKDETDLMINVIVALNEEKDKEVNELSIKIEPTYNNKTFLFKIDDINTLEEFNKKYTYLIIPNDDENAKFTIKSEKSEEEKVISKQIVTNTIGERSETYNIISEVKEIKPPQEDDVFGVSVWVTKQSESQSQSQTQKIESVKFENDTYYFEIPREYKGDVKYNVKSNDDNGQVEITDGAQIEGDFDEKKTIINKIGDKEKKFYIATKIKMAQLPPATPELAAGDLVRWKQKDKDNYISAEIESIDDDNYYMKDNSGQLKNKFHLPKKTHKLELVAKKEEIESFLKKWKPNVGEEIAVYTHDNSLPDSIDGKIKSIINDKEAQVDTNNDGKTDFKGRYKEKRQMDLDKNDPNKVIIPIDVKKNAEIEKIRKISLDRIQQIRNTDAGKKNLSLLKKAKTIIDYFIVASRLPEEIDAGSKLLNKVLDKAETVMENYSSYEKFISNKIDIELDILFNKCVFVACERFNESQEERTQTTQGQKDKGNSVNVRIIKMDSRNRKLAGLGGNSSLDEILGKSGKKSGVSEQNAELLKSYGSIDINHLKSEEIVKKFIENSELRKDAIELVDKEALKEIALRAQWMYDDEKYKDKRTDIYSRINFTTMGSDMSKLKNKWMKLLKKASSDYSPFFGQPFPQSLDPIALINSDEAFRKTFDQYKNPDDHSVISGAPIVPDDPGKGLIEFGKLTKGKTNKDNYGLFIVNTNGELSRKIGIIYKKLENKPLTIYKLMGVLDYDKMNSDERSEKGDEKDIRELISEYHYSKTGLAGTTSIQTADEEMKNIYKVFRGDSEKLKALGIKDGKQYTVGFYRTQDVESSNKMNYFTQLIITSDNWELQDYKTYIPRIKSSVVESYNLLNEITIDKKDNYRFQFNVESNYSIDNDIINDIWGIPNFGDQDKWKNRDLSSDKNKKLLFEKNLFNK